MTSPSLSHIALIGAGNLGQALAEGLLHRRILPASSICMTRHRTSLLEPFARQGVMVTEDNHVACRHAGILLLAVKPFKVREVVQEMAPSLLPGHILVSVATGVPMNDLRQWSGGKAEVFRAMPNTAVSIGESLTCIARDGGDDSAFQTVHELFDRLGRAVEIPEELMNAATVLGACGVAYALRFIRAMVQGGIEIGFDAQTAALIANQTVRGAATILLDGNLHPEAEIDKVTTPKGCTIAGLNEMEHQGFSSSLIKGITTSYEKIA